MKHLKLLLWSVLGILLIATTACEEIGPIVNIPPPFQFSIEEMSTNATGRASDVEIVGKIKVKNETDGDLELTWRRSNEALPRNWTTAICDHVLCYGSHIGERPIVLTAQQEIEMKINFYPNNSAGQGSADLSLFVTADETNTIETVTFSATAF